MIDLCTDSAPSFWDAALSTQPEASIFHHTGWIEGIRASYGYRTFWLSTRGKDSERPLLPVMEVRDPFGGRRAVALPFTDECHPLCTDATDFGGLWQALLDCGKKRSWNTIEVRGGASCLPSAPSAARYLGHKLDLSPGAAALLSRTHEATRRAVRKATERGVVVSQGTTLSELREFYGLLCRTRRRHAVPPPPFYFFQNIQEKVLNKGLGSIIIGRHQGRTIAGAVFLHLGRKVVYKWGASDERFQQLRANNLVMWEGIKRYATDGFTCFCFGRTDLDNEGLARFKQGWGASEYSIDYLSFDLRKGVFREAAARTGGRPWYAPLFQRIPLCLARLIGRTLYRYVG